MDNKERNDRRNPAEALEALWLDASRDAQAEGAFLRELSRQQVVTLLKQRPGPGPADPGHNLVQWQRSTNGMTFVPVFTSVQQLTITPPPPAQAVRVPMRLLLAAVDGQYCIVNPLSDMPFELKESQIAQLLGYMAKAHQEVGNPSRVAPWVFRLPDDSLYSVAVKLVEWFNLHGRVDRAFLYELLRSSGSQPVIVLGLEERADVTLADTLTAVAIQAGVDPANFVVRFLPEEPSHREGILRGGITPFYQRPRLPHH
ncbi:SseB family protein [Dyella jiangningensis]|uniref:SseB family protein n=1 Tax=Dyella jiangningensis TaxID=1379159 RepID=UPI00240F8C15|nr:SseB family protein [Dyella jiangningensis]MDG2538727.1 SseB family protein [Dyella jiangningensis]